VQPHSRPPVPGECPAPPFLRGGIVGACRHAT
jgi:hypothetical protein